MRVPVLLYSDLGQTETGLKRVASYSRGWIWPFGLLRPGKIRMLVDRAHSLDGLVVLGHEMQHVRDMSSPLWVLRRIYMSRVKRRYWLELRAEAQEILIRGHLNAAGHTMTDSINRLQTLSPGRARADVRQDLMGALDKVSYRPVRRV